MRVNNDRICTEDIRHWWPVSVCLSVSPWASNDVLFPVSEQISVLELSAGFMR